MFRVPSYCFFPEVAFAFPPAQPGQPTYLYDNVFKMCAICKDSSNKEVEMPLVAKEGSDLLEFEISPGVWWKSGVPTSMLAAMQKPTAVQKRPAAAAAATTKSAKIQKTEAQQPAQQPATEQPATEQPAQQPATEHPAKTEAQQPATEQAAKTEAQQPATEQPAAEPSNQQSRIRVSGKQTLVSGVIMVHAKKGNERAYALAKVGVKKRLLMEISKHASPNYLNLVKRVCGEMSSLVSNGVDFTTLKAWARAKRANLLAV